MNFCGQCDAKVPALSLIHCGHKVEAERSHPIVLGLESFCFAMQFML